MILSARASLHGHAGEVQGSVGILDRHLVEVDRLVASHQPTDLALAYQVHDPGHGHRVEAIRRLNGRTSIGSALATCTCQANGLPNFMGKRRGYSRKVHSWSSALMPPLITAEPTSMPLVSCPP